MLKYLLIVLLFLPILVFGQDTSAFKSKIVPINIGVYSSPTSAGTLEWHKVVYISDADIKDILKYLEDYKFIIFFSQYYGTDTKAKIAEIQQHINSLKQYYNIK